MCQGYNTQLMNELPCILYYITKLCLCAKQRALMLEQIVVSQLVKSFMILAYRLDHATAFIFSFRVRNAWQQNFFHNYE